MYHHYHRFGGSAEDYPHPDLDAAGFMECISAANKKEDKIWSPIAKKPRYWIEVSEMKSVVGANKCTIM